MKLVAMDVATQCGVAVGSSGSDPALWSVDLGEGRSEDARFSQVLILTHKLLEEHKPDLLAIEAPIGGRFKSDYLIGLVACIRGCAANRKVPAIKYDIGEIRKSFCGRALRKKDFPGANDNQRGKALKAEVVRHAVLRGWTVPDHDAADAGALWEFAMAKAGLQIRLGEGLFSK